MTFKERVGRIKDWCIEHKVEIAVATVGVVGCGAMCYGVKKWNDISNAQIEELREACDFTIEDLEVGMFANGVRKQFLNAGDGDTVTDITETLQIMKSIVPGEDKLCALQNGKKVLVMAQDIPVARGIEAIKAVQDEIPGIDDLEIWIGGTIKE